MNICVFGLWHLGCTTAACLARHGFQVVGLDFDREVVRNLQQGHAPLMEPGLDELIAYSLCQQTLRFSSQPEKALRGVDLLWVTFDTPVDESDEADVSFVEQQLQRVLPSIRANTVVLISSQVPVGFTGRLEQEWQSKAPDKSLIFAYSPENLRLGKAIESFSNPERVIVGLRGDKGKEQIAKVFSPFCSHIEWMSIESAEMTKHALNAFLAMSIAFTNELARVCERMGADAKDVERGLRSEPRIGPKAYLSPGAAYAGGTLARDVKSMIQLGRQTGVPTPLFEAIQASNDTHKRWIQDKLTEILGSTQDKVVAILGLTYKPGTSTLRRSASLELCAWLRNQGVRVHAHDPAVAMLPEDIQTDIQLFETPELALTGADAAVIATEWPEYGGLDAEKFLRAMRSPYVIDQNRFLADRLENDPRILYATVGRPFATRLED